MKHNVNKIFCGVFAALLTPFNAKGAICETRLKQLVNFLLSKGINGFYVCGGTGEGPLMDVDERKHVVEIVKRTVGNKAAIIAHVGGTNNTRNAVSLARHAEQIGCDGVSSVFPGYYAYSFEEYFRYYKSLAECTQLPFFIYYNPHVGGGSSANKMAQFAKIRNIVGIKYTDYDLFSLQRLQQQINDKWIVFSGPDEFFLPALTMGVVGSIGGTQNILPEVYIQIYKNFKAGNIQEAMRLQRKITNVVSLLLTNGFIRSLKTVLRFRGLDGGCCRPPYLEKVSPEQERNMRKQWKELMPEYAENL
ncbi:MAG: dihydrodipicolinate synthase family protein [Kiritimatiellaeota bacterium]|nr:dihydrodipicolinate synthase family protein [Kiritimatiellota bacterium]